MSDMQTICDALRVEMPAGELDVAGLAFAAHLAVLDGMARCPVTFEEFQDPVTDLHGYPVERAAAEAWFAEGNTTSVVSGAELTDLSLTPSPMCRVVRALFVEAGTLLAAPVHVEATETLYARHLVALSQALTCPITLEVLERPHVTADGHTYELEAILRWFEEGNDTSPVTGLDLPRVLNCHWLAEKLLKILGDAEEELECLRLT